MDLPLQHDSSLERLDHGKEEGEWTRLLVGIESSLTPPPREFAPTEDYPGSTTESALFPSSSPLESPPPSDAQTMFTAKDNGEEAFITRGEREDLSEINVDPRNLIDWHTLTPPREGNNLDEEGTSDKEEISLKRQTSVSIQEEMEQSIGSSREIGKEIPSVTAEPTHVIQRNDVEGEEYLRAGFGNNDGDGDDDSELARSEVEKLTFERSQEGVEADEISEMSSEVERDKVEYDEISLHKDAVQQVYEVKCRPKRKRAEVGKGAETSYEKDPLRKKNWDIWVEIKVSKASALSDGNDNEMSDHPEDSPQGKATRNKINGSRTKPAKKQAVRTTLSRKSRAGPHAVKKNKHMQASRRSGRLFQSSESNNTRPKYEFPRNLDQLTRETLLSCLNDDERAKEGDEVAMLLHLFSYFDANDFDEKSKSERLAEMSQLLKFRRELPNGLKNPLTMLQKRALLWRANEKLPRFECGLSVKQAVKAVSYIAEVVEEHGQKSRWKALRSQRDFQASSLSALKERYDSSIEELISALKMGELAP
ncbi:hypothetical protein CBS101457_001934 [Exobasidium rhododendri]|nr:hypothetical protein CBS101457_001934 [Exobasidium rhododendri]